MELIKFLFFIAFTVPMTNGQSQCGSSLSNSSHTPMKPVVVDTFINMIKMVDLDETGGR